MWQGAGAQRPASPAVPGTVTAPAPLASLGEAGWPGRELGPWPSRGGWVVKGWAAR